MVTLGLLAVWACSPQPQPIAYGDDACETCLMGIADERWGSEIVTRTGKIHTFDSVECMVAYLLHEAEPEEVHSVWVTDFADPPTLISVAEAFFLRSDNLKSPMGLGLTAFGEESIRSRAVLDSFGGDLFSWDQVVEHVRSQWPEGGPHVKPRMSRALP
jgi:copper chaperone NosL